jgi:hypothetical protein
MKQVKTIPQLEYAAKRDPWLDKLFDGNLYEMTATDWKGRYATVRSAASAVKQAAEHRGIAATVAIRGEALYVQANSNGQAKPRARKAATKKAAAPKAATNGTAKKAAPRPRKAAAKAS